MNELYGFDAYAPAEIAHRIRTVGAAKARLALVPLLMLGVLAGAFIGLGSMLFVIVRADSTLGLAASQFVSGAVFSVGLLMVVVAGAELFTGNNLLVLAWAEHRITAAQVLRNWLLVCLANFAGAAGLAYLVYLSGHTDLGGGALGRAVVRIAQAKQELPWNQAFLRGVLCNVLVCMAVWMAMAGRSVIDKAVAVFFPVTAFVAAGFEHSIANMYLMPLAMLVQSADPVAGIPLTLAGMTWNLAFVIAGNLAGGAVLVGLTYQFIYRTAEQTKGSASVDIDQPVERPVS
jgi:formate transporter